MRRILWLQLVTAVAVLIALGAVGYVAWQGFEAHHALCVFKGDLQRRADGTREFLALHPNGIAGISHADLQRSIDNQQATLDALSSLSCSPLKGAS